MYWLAFVVLSMNQPIGHFKAPTPYETFEQCVESATPIVADLYGKLVQMVPELKIGYGCLNEAQLKEVEESFGGPAHKI